MTTSPSNKFDLSSATKLIIHEAGKVVSQLIEHRGNDNPPFFIREYTSFFGIKQIVKVDIGDSDAILFRFQNGAQIRVNSKQSQERQAFSCAHEFGHILLDRLNLSLSIDKVEFRSGQMERALMTKLKERLCNIAASELLMPESIFKRYLNEFGVSINSVNHMANFFNVSVEAAAIRIAELSDEPCIALRWSMKNSNRSRTIILDRKVGPGREYDAISGPINTTVDYPSSIHDAYYKNTLTKCTKAFRLRSVIKRIPMESKGFGYGFNRKVLSLAFPLRLA